jgi:L-histidine Nalpha-methyltransferase / hercynylcysteine S-oxide synthase
VAEKGLKLFEDITYLDEYYLTNAEIDALRTHAAAVAERVPAGTRLIELGSGSVTFSCLTYPLKSVQLHAIE